MEENKDYIWNLIARKLTGDATEDELAELELFLLKNPGENYSMEILTDLWNSKSDLNNQYSENKYKELLLRMQQTGVDIAHFDQKSETIGNQRKSGLRKSTKWLLGLMAVFVAGLTVFLLLQKDTVALDTLPQEKQLTKMEFKTNNGSKTNMVLPDGTKVWLNAGSKMTYDKNYGAAVREVNLIGEAYFDVVKNEEKPFIIHAGDINIKVLGTAFNVRCYPDEKNTETSLVRGSLEVTMKGSTEKYLLKPNEKLIVSNDRKIPATGKSSEIGIATVLPEHKVELSSLSLLPQDNSIIETSWVYNRLVFSSETFEEVAVKMERWYAVDITIKNEKLKAQKFTGVFENETVSQALDAIQLTTPFSYRINNNQIIISK